MATTNINTTAPCSTAAPTQAPAIVIGADLAQSCKLRPSDDLWVLALQKLSKHEREAIQFEKNNKLTTITYLLNQVKAAEEECKGRQWRYKRSNGKGESVIIRDILSKLVKWIERFKQIGDAAVQYDPIHAALPWAGVRFLLEMAMGDIEKFAFVTEGAEVIARTIDRCAIFESIYLQNSSSSLKNRLEASLTLLYAAILRYLAKAKHYFEESTGLRILKSVVISRMRLESSLEDITSAEAYANDCAGLMEAELARATARDIASKSEEQERSQKALLALLHDIEGPVDRIAGQLRSFEDNLLTKKRLEILEWMSSQPYKAHHNQNKRDILQGTGNWLLEDPVFVQWIKDSASSLLWLHGSSGTGKTKLVAIVIEELLHQYEIGRSSQPIYFYCSRNTQENLRSNPEAILANLARQLSSLEPGSPILPPSMHLYTRRESEGFSSGGPAIEESVHLISQLTAYYPITIIVLDALDECNMETRHLLLDAFEQFLSQSQGLVKVLISSREEGDLVCELRDYPSLKISSTRNSKDIENFVRTETERLVAKRRLLRYSSNKSELQALIIDSLISRADGMFRWVSMSLEALCSMKNDNDVLSRLGKLPRRLASLYLDIYQGFFENTYETSQALIKNTFKWLMCVDGPLKSGEFLAAIVQNLSPAPFTLVRDELLDLCCNFVTLDENLDMFRFAHPSVKEFLEGLVDYSSEASNALAAECCLVYLTSRAQIPSVRRFLADKYDFKDGGKPSIRTSTYSHAFGTYATRLGMSHCSSAGTFRSCDPLKSITEVFLLSDGGRSSPLSLWLTLVSRSKPLAFAYFDNFIKSEKDPMSRPFVVACAFGFLEVVDKLLHTSITTSTTVLGFLIALQTKSLVLARRILANRDGVNLNPPFYTDIDSFSTEKMLRVGFYSPLMIESLLQLEDLDIEGLIRRIILVQGNSPFILSRVLDYDRSFLVSKELMTAAIEASSPSIIAALAPLVELTDELLLSAMSHPRQGPIMAKLLLRHHPYFHITCDLLYRMTRLSIPLTETMDSIWELWRSQGQEFEMLLEVVRHQRDQHHWIPRALLWRYDRDDIKGLLCLLGTSGRRGQNYRARLLRDAAVGPDGEGKALYEQIVAWFATRSAINERFWAQTVMLSLKKNEFLDLMELVNNAKNIVITPEWLEVLVETQHPVFLDILFRQRKDIQITERIVIAAMRTVKNPLWMVSSVLRRAFGLRITRSILDACIDLTYQRDPIMSVLLVWDPGAYIPKEIFAVLYQVAFFYREGQELIELLHEQQGRKMGLAEFEF